MTSELGASGTTVLRRYVHGAGLDEPVLWWEGAGTTDGRSLLADRQGSIVATAPLAGGTSAVSLYTYGPYGERTSWGGSRFAYTGQIALAEASPYHYKARAYDPARGWFLQTDPIGYEAGDFNLYAYVGGDPVNKSDPSGLCDPNTQCLTPPPEDKPKGWSCDNDSQCSSMAGDAAGSGFSNLSINRSLDQQKTDFAKSQAVTTPEVNRQLLEGAGTLIGAAIPLAKVVQIVGRAAKAAEIIEVYGLRGTINRIARGEKFPHRNDSKEWLNRDNQLPVNSKGYYTEYVAPSPLAKDPGLGRIVMGKDGEIYYSPDHYAHFIRVK